MIKRFFLKFLLLILLVGGVQLVFIQFNPIHSVPEIQHLNNLLGNDVNIIYFGDSTITATAIHEENKEPISTILQDSLPNLKIGRVSHAAYHLDLYLEFARYIVQQEKQPQVVIIPINLRSFSTGWDLKPAYQFEKEARFLKQNNNLFVQAFDTPLSIFRWYQPELSQKAFEEIAIYYASQKVGNVKEFERVLIENSSPTQTNQEKILIYNYLYDLNPKHRKLQSLLKLVDNYRSNDIDVILYITPIDYQLGKSLLGDQFNQQVENNISSIKSIVSEKDVVLLDLTFALTSENFGWHNFPNEHLNEEGRNFVAEQLSQELIKLEN